MLGMFLGALEATVVVTAMPTVISSLGGLELYSWVFSLYFLTTTVTVPLWGRLSDLYGRRFFYLAGIILFVSGSMACGLSSSMTQLIIFRAVQGTGAGALIPLGMTIIGDIFPLERRARMQGLFSGVWGLASILGPPVGGFVTDQFSWRWVFFLNLPFGILAGAIIAIALREPKSTHTQRVDYVGAGLLVLSLSALFIGLDQWGTEGSQGLSSLLVVLALGLLLVFWLVQRRIPDPILPLHLFRDRLFFAATANGLFSGMALFGAISFIPLFVQGVLGTTATEAGYSMTALMAGWVIFSVISSRLILVLNYRTIVITGMVFLMGGFFVLSRVTSDSSEREIQILMFVVGMGMGLSAIPMVIAVQNRFPREFRGVATSATQFFRTIGASVGIAIMGSIMARDMLSRLSRLRSPSQAKELAYFAHHPDAILNPAYKSQIPAPIMETLREVLGSALQDVFFTGFVVSILAFASAFLVPRGSAHDLRENQPLQEPKQA